MRKLPCILCILLMVTSLLCASASAGDNRARTAIVNNPNPADRLHLRTKPDSTAPSLGKYYSGVEVTVLSTQGADWAKVRIGILEGYMQTKYLALDAQPRSVKSAIPTLTVSNPNATDRLNLREKQSATSASLGRYYNGTSVEVLGVGDTWDHVRVDGKLGFMMAKYLSASQNITGAATVNNPKPTDRLNLRTKPNDTAPSQGRYYNGTAVTVLENTSSAWVKVKIGTGTGAAEGYMQTKYLAAGAAAQTVQSAKPVYTAKAAFDLLQSASGGAKVVASFGIGQRIEVLGILDTWWHVQVGNTTGYVRSDAAAFR